MLRTLTSRERRRLRPTHLGRENARDSQSADDVTAGVRLALFARVHRFVAASALLSVIAIVGCTQQIPTYSRGERDGGARDGGSRDGGAPPKGPPTGPSTGPATGPTGPRDGGTSPTTGTRPPPSSDAGTGPTPPAGLCGDLTYIGRCEGNVAVWCDDTGRKTRDCTLYGQRCGYIDEQTGYYCAFTGGTAPPPAPPTDAGTTTRPPADTGTPGISLTAAEQDLLRALNDERAANGLPAVSADPQLMCAARNHVMDVGATGACGHISSDGRNWVDRAMECGLNESAAWLVNEIAAGPGFSDGADAVWGWRQSSGHHRAIVHPSATTVGVGIYNSCFIAVFDCCIAGSE